ncbi:MAG: hypothetical protein RLY16_917 [Bacteroidota bacterium]
MPNFFRERYTETIKMKAGMEKREEERLLFATRLLNDFIFDYDLVTKDFFVSDEWWIALGYVPGELPNSFEGILQTICEPERIWFLQYFDYFLKSTETSASFELKVNSKEGGEKWIFEKAEKVNWDAKGNPTRIIGVFKDITVNKLLQIQQQKENKNKEALINATNDVIYSVDLNLNLTAANNAFVDTNYPSSYHPPAKIGDHILDDFYYLPEEKETWKNHFQRVFAGETISFEKQIQLPGLGLSKWVVTTMHPIIENDCVVGAAIFSQDISARKLAELNLLESEQQFRFFFEKNSAIMYLLDAGNGNVLDANEKAVQFYGYDLDAFRKLNIADINCLPQEECLQAIQSVKIQKQESFIFPHLLANGEIRTVNAYGTFVRELNREVVFVIVVDVTEKIKAEASLKIERDNFKSLIKAIPDILFRLNQHNIFTYSHSNDPNQSSSEELFVGKSVSDVFPDSIVKEFEQRILEARLCDTAITHEYCIDAVGQESAYFEARFVKANEHDILAVIRNITDKKQVENSLAEKLHIIETAQNVAQVGYFVNELTTDIWDCSAIHDEIYGIPINTLKSGSELIDLMLPEFRAGLIELYRKSRTNKLGFSYKYQIIRLTDKSVRWIKLFARFVYDKEGIPTHFIGAIQDITEMENLVADKERILESISDYFYVLDKDQRFIYCNNSFLRKFQIKGENIVGKKVLDVFPRLLNTAFPLKLMHAIETGEYVCFEMYVEGSDTWYEQYFYPFNGGCTSMFKDINARKLAEQSLITANNLLQSKTAELTQLNNELEQFAYVASHDLQEPLRMVTSFLALFEKRYQDQVDETGANYIHYAIDGANRMKVLIKDLLQYSRAGSASLPLEIVDMKSVLLEALDLHQQTISEIQANITYDPLPLVYANKGAMIQLMQNLVGNALKYTNKQQVAIHVGVEKNNQEYIFSVKDNGIGIESKYFDKIFVIFQRLHTASEYSGTGIGLSVCKKIIERLKGRIWVNSELNKGTTFYFSIPIPSDSMVKKL